MKKFVLKFQREFEVGLEAADVQTAEQLAREILAQFPAGTTKLLSILPEGYVEPVEASEPEKPTPPPRGRPNGGGTPGTPTARVPVLEDQIAKAA